MPLCGAVTLYIVQTYADTSHFLFSSFISNIQTTVL